MSSGHVVNYRRMPPVAPFLWAALVLAVGVGLWWYWTRGLSYADEAAPARGRLALAVSIIISGLMVISATSKLWFRHLWHRRRVPRE